MRSVRLFAALVAVSVVFAPAAGAQQTEVGTTAATNTDTRGTPPGLASRSLFIGTNVFFEERIETSKTGQAQLLFLDESALTIASSSDVVLDKFIYDPKTSKGELALSLGAGLFRFVGGRISKTSGVTIKTPTATIGIRGGIVIIKVEPKTGATRATFVFGKEMTVTNKSGVTRRVTRPGFSVDVASLDDPPSSPFKVSGVNMTSYLTELEGRTGQTAGLTEPLTDVQVADSGIDQVGSSNDPDTIVAEETAATGGTDGGDPPLPIIPDLQSEITSTNSSSNPPPSSFGVTATRTLNGFAGGVFALIEEGEFGPTITSTGTFANTSGDPADIEIITETVSGTTSNGIVTASFDVQILDGVGNDQRLEAEFGGTGETSEFFNDDSFFAIATSATFDGSPVATDDLVIFLTTNDFGGPGLENVEFCQCEFLQWGFWGGGLQLSEIGDDVVLAYWVAGEIPALVDMPILGTATYTGHIIGIVTLSNESIIPRDGGFSQTYDFATGSGSFSVTNFDGVNYSGSVDAISGQENLFTGSGTGGSRDIDLNGAFFSGGGDPVAEVGGGFTINGLDYEASGIFAGAK